MGGLSLRVTSDDEYDRFKKILFDTEIATFLLTNLKEAQENHNKLKNDNLICYLFRHDDKDIGIAAALIFPLINKCILDVGALKEYRGRLVKDCAVDAIKDFLDNYDGYELFSYVRSNNKKSLYFSQNVGLKILRKVNDNYILRFDYGFFNRKYA